jgi:hypothetical protein
MGKYSRSGVKQMDDEYGDPIQAGEFPRVGDGVKLDPETKCAMKARKATDTLIGIAIKDVAKGEIFMPLKFSGPGSLGKAKFNTPWEPKAD